MPRLLILCATQFEMALFLDRHPQLVKEKTPSHLTLYSGVLGQTFVDCVISGPGVFNTVHALTVYLTQKRPSMILHTGIAGVFAPSGFGIGDIGIAAREQYVHTGVGCDTPEYAPLPFELICGQPLTRQGIYPADAKLLEPYRGLFSREVAGAIALGNFITVSSITPSFAQAQKLYDRFSPVMEAMEGAAAFHVAALYKVPVIEIRAVSNFVGERDKGKWDFPLACERICQICRMVLTHPI
ncbi:MAG: futalosine hydrolase [Proteobacteria bacterium]|nr:futalosine hydrolase [Desulfobacula sp.]MBU3951784.1 futalosine hydrolase [Pseudomonadota bacterium]MBU4131414.1 futalosine hydrolase [Pseudomonadota bacterium]